MSRIVIEKLEYLLSDLDEDSPTRLFLDGGMYRIWRPREHGPRLTYIHPDDFIREPGDVLYEGSQSWGELLYIRNNQLTHFIVNIAAVCEVPHQDSILEKATSWAWIQAYLGIQATQVQKYRSGSSSIETKVQKETQEIEVQKQKKQTKQKKQKKTQIEDDISRQGPSSSSFKQKRVEHSYMTRMKKRSLRSASVEEEDSEERDLKRQKFDL